MGVQGRVLIVMQWICSALFAPFVSKVVERSKKTLDFCATIQFWHCVFMCMQFEIPGFTWWTTAIVGVFIKFLISAEICIHWEMRDISMGDSSNNHSMNGSSSSGSRKKKNSSGGNMIGKSALTGTSHGPPDDSYRSRFAAFSNIIRGPDAHDTVRYLPVSTMASTDGNVRREAEHMIPIDNPLPDLPDTPHAHEFLADIDLLSPDVHTNNMKNDMSNDLV